MNGLIATLRDALPARVVADEVGGCLFAVIGRATAAWPGVEVAPERFVRAIAERLGPADIATSLDALHTDDLYLACACADGDPVALEAFERHCGTMIERTLVRARVPEAHRADVGQIVRNRLLVATPDAPPRIVGYSAHGPLRTWVRVVVVREAARMLPNALREPLAEDYQLGSLPAREDDPELAYLKRHYREALKQALEAAITTLEDRERLVLRQHSLDRLSIDEIAVLHHVHRATAARWIESARNTVALAAQRELLRHLRVTRPELDSIVRLVASQLDVSLPRLLAV